MVGIVSSLVLLVITILYSFFGNIPPPGWDKLKFVKVAIAIEIACLAISVFEISVLSEDPLLINKPVPGKGMIIDNRFLSVENELSREFFEFDVPERKLTQEEINEAFFAAKQEVDASFVGENQDVDHIDKNLVLLNSYVDGIILAEWRFDDYTYISADGSLKNQDLQEPVICQAFVTLYYDDVSEEYIFPFRIVPVTRTPTEEFLYELHEEISRRFFDSRYDSESMLLTSFNGKELVWEKKKTYKGLVALSVGMVVLFGLGIGKNAENRKQQKEREEKMKLEYSDIISTLALLLGAGMSVRKSWEKMVVNKKDRAGPLSPAYAEMEMALNQMHSGVSDVVAIENFGARTRLPMYKKAAGILVNYIKKGSKDLANQLNNEVEFAFEERKAMAKIEGELVGTKLLMPMLMQLMVALVIIIVPALLSFSF